MTNNKLATLGLYPIVTKPTETQSYPKPAGIQVQPINRSFSNRLNNKLQPHIDDFIWQKTLHSRLLLCFSLINRRGLPVPSAVFQKLSYHNVEEPTDDFGSENFLSSYMIPPQGKCLVDVGACVGLWALFAAKKGVEVYAFEPSPIAYNLLAKLAVNHPNLHTYPYALGDVNATQKMCISKYEIGAVMNQEQTKRVGGKTVVDQTVHTLDSMNLEQVGVLKIDTEGYEMPILRGAQKTIRKNQPLLIIEVHKETGQAAKTFEAELNRIQNQLKEFDYTWILHYRPVSLRQMQPHIIAKPLKNTPQLEFSIACPTCDNLAPTLYS